MKPISEMSTDELRAMLDRTIPQLERVWFLRHGLDLKVPPHTRDERGDWLVLTAETECAVIERRVRHEIGVRGVAAWATLHPQIVPRNAFVFWHTLHKTRRPVPTKAVPPESFQDGVLSLIENAGLLLHCVGYSKGDVYESWLGPLPAASPPIVFLDAGAFLPWTDFQRLLRAGVPVAILADFILELARFQYGGWRCDGDTLWIGRAPDLVVGGEPPFGHRAHAMAASRASPRGSLQTKFNWWTKHYCSQPVDYRFFATPTAGPAGSPCFAAIIEAMSTVLLSDDFHARLLGGDKDAQYRFAMRIMKDYMH